MTINISFPSGDYALAAAIGTALTAYGHGHAVVMTPVPFERSAVPQLLATNEVVVVDTTDGDETTDTSHIEDEPPKSAALDDHHEAPTADEETPPAQTDCDGVAWHAEFCSKAAKPFYGSGKNEGRWKKRQGVDQGEYDAWHAEQAAAYLAASTTGREGETIDTAGAFGAQPSGPAGPTATAVPQNAGELMKYTSEMTAAGRLSAQDLTEVMADNDVQTADLFTATPMVIAAVYASLAKRVKTA